MYVLPSLRPKGYPYFPSYKSLVSSLPFQFHSMTRLNGGKGHSSPHLGSWKAFKVLVPHPPTNRVSNGVRESGTQAGHVKPCPLGCWPPSGSTQDTGLCHAWYDRDTPLTGRPSSSGTRDDAHLPVSPKFVAKAASSVTGVGSISTCQPFVPSLNRLVARTGM